MMPLGVEETSKVGSEAREGGRDGVGVSGDRKHGFGRADQRMGGREAAKKSKFDHFCTKSAIARNLPNRGV